MSKYLTPSGRIIKATKKCEICNSKFRTTNKENNYCDSCWIKTSNYFNT